MDNKVVSKPLIMIIGTIPLTRLIQPVLLIGQFCLLVLLPLLISHSAYAAEDSLRVAVISDMNSSYGSTSYEPAVDRAIHRIIELKPDLVISTGDMVAGQRRPHLARNQLENMWGAFHEHVSNPLQAAGIPLLVTPGNHDASAYRGFSLERAIYGEQWRQRQPDLRFIDNSNYPYHYAFSIKDTLFISLDATIIGHLPDEQIDWLRGILGKHDKEHKHRVVFSHLPMWPFAKSREREFIGDPKLLSLLESADVRLYLSGHHHAFYPGIHGNIAYVSQACLGAGPRKLLGDSRRSKRSFTMLEFTDNDILVAAVEAPQYKRIIDWTTLPESVHHGEHNFYRADLVEHAPISPKTRFTPDPR